VPLVEDALVPVVRLRTPLTPPTGFTRAPLPGLPGRVSYSALWRGEEWCCSSRAVWILRGIWKIRNLLEECLLTHIQISKTPRLTPFCRYLLHRLLRGLREKKERLLRWVASLLVALRFAAYTLCCSAALLHTYGRLPPPRVPVPRNPASWTRLASS
jgi:hypothetical protein